MPAAYGGHRRLSDGHSARRPWQNAVNEVFGWKLQALSLIGRSDPAWSFAESHDDHLAG